MQPEFQLDSDSSCLTGEVIVSTSDTSGPLLLHATRETIRSLVTVTTYLLG